MNSLVNPQRASASRRCLKSGFTLVELLTVIAIIGVLAAVLIPTIGRARESAKSTTCTNNLRQVGVAIQGYISDNKGSLPPATPWFRARFNADPRHFQTALLPYLGQSKTTYWGNKTEQMTYSPMFDCPGYKGESLTTARYALNKAGTAEDGTPTTKLWGDDLYQDLKTGQFKSPKPTKYASIPVRNKAIVDSDLSTTERNHSGFQNALYFDWHVGRVPTAN